MVPSPIYCTNCGAPNQAQAKFCFSCGQSLQGVLPASSTNSATGLLVANHLLKQRYRIHSQAGKGGFAAVYKAEDTLFGNRFIAVKEMSQSGEVTTVTWSPGVKRIASGSSDMIVQVWDAATGDHIITYKGHADKVNTVAWSPDGKYIASGSADGVVQIWQAPSD
jgi:WD40 repeat protein